MSKTNGNDRAVFDAGDVCIYAHGLTKREYFAALALQGFVTKNLTVYRDEDNPYEIRAEWAVKQSDALIAELNKGSDK